MDRRAFLRTMRILEARYPVEDWSTSMTAFEVLVSTILSQSTTVANERRGLDGLRRAFGQVTPHVLAAATSGEIERAIWHAGLAKRKASRIRDAAREVRDRWHGDLSRIFALPSAQAREILTTLPGVGPKTADVVLAMAGGRSVFPVDTHIARIARRWGLLRHGGYEATRAALESWTPPDKRRAWHLAIIAHGRALCRARNPLCHLCPVARDCDWYLRGRGKNPTEPKPRTRRPR